MKDERQNMVGFGGDTELVPLSEADTAMGVAEHGARQGYCPACREAFSERLDLRAFEALDPQRCLRCGEEVLPMVRQVYLRASGEGRSA